MTAPDDLELIAAAGFVERSLVDELPGLRLDWVSARARRCPSRRKVKHPQ